MSLILKQSQAEAVYSAMCALNNVGGRINATLNETERVVERISGSIYVLAWIDCDWVPREHYTDQNAFAEAYGLL